MLIGVLALLSGKTAEIITISVFGALTLYIIAMLSLIKLRKQQSNLHRPYRVPFYPSFPVSALFIAVISFIAMGIYYSQQCLIYCGLLLLAFLFFKLFKPTTA